MKFFQNFVFIKLLKNKLKVLFAFILSYFNKNFKLIKIFLKKNLFYFNISISTNYTLYLYYIWYLSTQYYIRLNIFIFKILLTIFNKQLLYSIAFNFYSAIKKKISETYNVIHNS